MDKVTLAAEPRKIFGKKLRALRKEGVLPANIFGKKIKSQAISVKLSDFEKVFKKAGETNLIYLDIKGDKTKEDRAVLVSNLQLNPVSDAPIHVDFHQVDLKEKVTAHIPVELTGESPAEKTGVGTVVLYVNEVEVVALPKDLPDKFLIDISILTEVGQAVKVVDLKVDRKLVEVKTDAETIVAKVEPPQKIEEVAPVAAAEGEVPAEGEAAPAAPAEGETPAPEVGETQEQKKE